MNKKILIPADFLKFFELFYKPLCLFINSYAENWLIAEEIAEDTFLKLWQSNENFQSETSIRSWLYTTARNKAIDHLRSTRTQQKRSEKILAQLSTEPDADALQQMIKSEIIAELHTLIRSLPQQCSYVFAKLYIDGKSVAETAKELNLSANTVKSHKARGLQLLRAKMQLPLWLLLMSQLFFRFV